MDESVAVQVFLGSVPILAALLTFILLQTIGERIKRNRLRGTARADLIAEIEQNALYQLHSKFIQLEDEAYKRFRQRGFLRELKNGLQKDLMMLYSRMHEKNDLLNYYQAFITGVPMPVRDNLASPLLAIIDRAEQQINEVAKAILPELKALSKDC